MQLTPARFTVESIVQLHSRADMKRRYQIYLRIKHGNLALEMLIALSLKRI